MKTAKNSMVNRMRFSPGWFRIWSVLSAIWVAGVLGYSFYVTPPPPEAGTFIFYLGHYSAMFMAVSLSAMILPVLALAVRWVVLKAIAMVKGGSGDR